MKCEEMAIRILECVAEIDGLEDDKELDLFEVGLLDSLAVISIIVQIEEMTGIALQPTDFLREDISSVEKFTSYLKIKGLAE